MTSGARWDHTNDPLSAESLLPSHVSCPSGPTSDTAGEWSTTVGSVAGLRTLRRTLSAWLSESGIDDGDFVSDIQLATVEVVTNALVHGMAELVSISLEITVGDVIVTTQHGATSDAEPFPATLPPNTSLSGRGLYIVDQVARERVVSHSDGVSTTRLQIPVPDDMLPELQLVATGT